MVNIIDASNMGSGTEMGVMDYLGAVPRPMQAFLVGPRCLVTDDEAGQKEIERKLGLLPNTEQVVLHFSSDRLHGADVYISDADGLPSALARVFAAMFGPDARVDASDEFKEIVEDEYADDRGVDYDGSVDAIRCAFDNGFVDYMMDRAGSQCDGKDGIGSTSFRETHPRTWAYIDGLAKRMESAGAYVPGKDMMDTCH